MKSSTSLIGFKNAVGVMLALSAIFAVVISAVTITQDRALGQATDDVPVTLRVEAETVQEGATVLFTVTLDEAVATDADDVIIIPLLVKDGIGERGATKTNDFTLPTESGSEVTSVTFAAGEDEHTYSITTIDTVDPFDPGNTDYAEPQEYFTVSLGTLPDGYDAVEPSSITININDDDNTAATGAVTIDIFDSLESLDRVDTTVPRSGQYLVANTSDIDDADQPSGEPPKFMYQWIRTDDGSTPTTDDDVKIDGAEKSFYELTHYDVGDKITVQVWSSDNYDNGNGNANTDAADSDVGENNNGQTLGRPASTAFVVYDKARPLIIEGVLQPEGDPRLLKPGVELTRDTSGMFNPGTELGDAYLIGMDGMEIKVNLDNNRETDETNVEFRDITFTWHREGKAIEECDDDFGLRTGAVTDTFPCDGAIYTLVDADVAKKIFVRASYLTLDASETTDANDVDVFEHIDSLSIGRVYSPNLATGMPRITGVAQVGSTLTAAKGTIADLDNAPDDPVVEADITYTWFHGDDDDYSDPLPNDDVKGTSYVLAPSDVGKTIKALASFEDGLGDPEMRVSGLTTEIAGSAGEISRIEAAIRGVTVSADDIVTLSVDIYGLQDAKDNTIGATFEWTLTSGESTEDLEGSGREIDFTAPSSPGRYTVTASLGGGECQPETEADRADDCSAEIEVQVRRPSAPVADPVPPVNPPGEIPGLIPDADGNQYEVFTPVEGGTFDGGEGYSINVPSGAVPNGEYIGIRMSDDGAASNVGMTHQRYTLGGNMYGVHAVDASGAAISSYVLEDPAEVCVPLPASLRANISHLSLAAINSDGSLTILAAQVRLDEAGGTMVCGNLSSLPASVAVGSAGAPAAIPTATPVPEPELPPTGGTSPASGSLVLWTLLLGIAVLTLGSALAIIRRLPSIPRSPSP